MIQKKYIEFSEELGECIDYTKRYLLQALQKNHKLPSDQESHAFFSAQPRIQTPFVQQKTFEEKNLIEKPTIKKEHITKPPQEIKEHHTIQAPITKQKIIETKKSAPQKLEEPTQEPEHPRFDPLRVPYLQILPSKEIVEQTHSLYGDIEIKIKKMNTPPKTCFLEDEQAKINASLWKKTAPQCMVLAFFTKESTEGVFIEKMATAISTKLVPTQLIFLPTTKEVAITTTGSYKGPLRKVLITYTDATYIMAKNWMLQLAPFSFIEKQPLSTPSFEPWGFQKECAFFHLKLDRQNIEDKDWKQTIWNVIKKYFSYE